MRSLADRARRALEWLCRATAIVLLAWLLIHTILVRRNGVVDQATAATLARKLAQWSTSASPSAVHVRLDHPPAGRERDWLAALPGAGTAVGWSGSSLRPTALSVEPRVDPARGADASVAAPNAAMVALSDTLGPLDSVRAAGTGARIYVPKVRRMVDARTGSVVARAPALDSVVLRKLLLLGQAGWEAKFTLAALEERGWVVDAHIVVSPKSDVMQGKILAIDTAHYSAVIALDSTAGRYSDRIAAFVKQGGGLIMWSPAARAPELAALAPGAGLGGVIQDDLDAPPDSAPRSVLELVPITSLREDAVVLERRGNDVGIAARRVGRGRVLETGYTDSWRWRMAGGSDALDRHREWIAGLVALAATGSYHEIAAAPGNVAPLATLVDKLGPATAPETDALDPMILTRWLFGAICAALILEWASRRTRGVK
jgi:hypothetical protein